MADKHYNADSLLLRCDFHLTDSRIIVTRSREKSEWSFALVDLVPTPERIHRHFPLLVYIPFSFAVILAWVTWEITKRNPVYAEAVLLVGGALTIGILFHVYRGLSPVEFARFRTKTGDIAFDIAKGNKQSLAFEYFLEELQKRIKNQCLR